MDVHGGYWWYVAVGMLAPETLQILFLHELLRHPQVRQSQQVLLLTTQGHEEAKNSNIRVTVFRSLCC